MFKNFPKPQIVVRNGKPEAVILDIRHFEKLLERVEDAEDLREIRKLRRSSRRFVPLEEYLARRH